MKNPKPRSVDSLNISIGTDKCCVKIWQQISRRQFQSYSTASKCKKNRIALFWISTGLITLSTETYGLSFNNDAYKPSSNRMRVGLKNVWISGEVIPRERKLHMKLFLVVFLIVLYVEQK